MSPKAIYRGVLTASVLTSIVAVALHFILRDSLPPPLKAWLEEQEKKQDDLPDDEVVLLAFSGLWLLAALVSLIGLYAFWRPARWLSVVVAVLFVPTAGMMGPTIDSGWEGGVGEIAILLAGAAMAMAYCQPFSNLFEWPNDESKDESSRVR